MQIWVGIVDFGIIYISQTYCLASKHGLRPAHERRARMFSVSCFDASTRAWHEFHGLVLCVAGVGGVLHR